jgi:hypothetical protein
MTLDVDKAVGAKIRDCRVTLIRHLRHAAGPGAQCAGSAHLKSLRHTRDVPSLAPLGISCRLTVAVCKQNKKIETSPHAKCPG